MTRNLRHLRRNVDSRTTHLSDIYMAIQRSCWKQKAVLHKACALVQMKPRRIRIIQIPKRSDNVRLRFITMSSTSIVATQ